MLPAGDRQHFEGEQRRPPTMMRDSLIISMELSTSWYLATIEYGFARLSPSGTHLHHGVGRLDVDEDRRSDVEVLRVCLPAKRHDSTVQHLPQPPVKGSRFIPWFHSFQFIQHGRWFLISCERLCRSMPRWSAVADPRSSSVQCNYICNRCVYCTVNRTHAKCALLTILPNQGDFCASVPWKALMNSTALAIKTSCTRLEHSR